MRFLHITHRWREYLQLIIITLWRDFTDRSDDDNFEIWVATQNRCRRA
ncbi:Uncharacterised protein [Vibrio cholerae]|uniref:Uncharacterized protein n=1 Tax=Vibrio cholerae TaxID=666 RepID=A0A656AIK9_VIBCL|nr:Uncharacterised protein [Vibrio cholerae]